MEHIGIILGILITIAYNTQYKNIPKIIPMCSIINKA